MNPRCYLWLAVLFVLIGHAPRCIAGQPFNSVYISEFLAENEHGLQDNDGDFFGWIEIYTGGLGTVNLNGWFLTDTTNNLTKWRFPRIWLLPEKDLLIFASGKDRTNDPAHLHTNFRLRKQGGYLALVNYRTNIVSEFAPYPQQSTDVSFGRVRGEPAIVGYFNRPTPGKSNAKSGKGFAPEVIFSRPSGTFTTPFQLQLAASSRRAVIRYTLDGRLPNSNSPVYKTPFLITNVTYIRARAYEEGLLPGPPSSEAYLQLYNNALSFSSTLPVLVMETFGRDAPSYSRYSPVHLSFYEPVNGKTYLTNPPTLATRGGFHVRGSSTSGMPQSSFAMKFLDEFDDEQDHPALGLPSDSDWVLYAPNHFDPIMIHNPFVHQLSREMGRYSPRTRFLEVFLVGGSRPINSMHYHGIYVLEEKIKVSKKRVNIQKLGADDLKPPEVTGGYLLKIDRPGPGENGFYAGGAGMMYVDPKEHVITLPQRAPQRQYLYNFFNDFDRALDGARWKDPVVGYRAYIDVDSWIDYHVLELLSGNVDIFGFSTFFYKPRNGKLMFGPHWDFDRALGSVDRRDANPRRWNTGPFFGGPWWPRLFSDPDFWQQWVDRWQDLRRNLFSLEHMNDIIDTMTDELREAQPREVKRWGLQPRWGTYQSEINHMKNWISNRVEFIDRQLTQPPRLNQEGGQVAPGFLLTLTAPANATIYYTLDGSDPRLSQGAISTNALIYTNPIAINAYTRVVARARNPSQRQYGGPQSSTPWSGPVRANFVTGR